MKLIRDDQLKALVAAATLVRAMDAGWADFWPCENEAERVLQLLRESGVPDLTSRVVGSKRAPS